MKTNNLYYGILLYIIIIASLVFVKPQFIYDHEKSKYKSYGLGDGKTLFTLPVLSFILATFIGIICVSNTDSTNDTNNTNNITFSSQSNDKFAQSKHIQYVPIYCHLNSIPYQIIESKNFK